MSHRLSSPSSRFAPVALLVVGMASVQVGAALAKSMFATVGALGAVALRVLFAAVMLVAVLRPWRVRRTPAAWRSVILYGASLGGMNALFYAALRTVPLGVATALEFTGPLAVALVASRRTADFLWVALAVAGLLALSPIGGAGTVGIDPAGAAYALGGGVCWALYIVFGRKAGAEHGLGTAAAGMSVAALVVLPVGIADAGAALLTPGIFPIALAVAVLSSALPYTLEMYALPRLPAKTFGTLMSIEPAFGALAGLALLGEHLGARQWLGVAAIIVTSVGTTLTATSAPMPTTEGAEPLAPEALPDVTRVAA
jgi:inner membrane transporter RhtA